MVNITPAAAFSDAVLAAELGISALANRADAVGVFDANFNQVFQKARPLDLEVVPRARLMDHPTEDGQTITDYKIILPTEIVLPLLIPAPFYRNTYQEIWNLWNDSALLSVQTKASNYFDMVITEPPHKETPDKFDVITVHLRLRQIQLRHQGSNFFPVTAVDADTTKIGQQFPSVLTLATSAIGAATTSRAIAAGFR